MIVEVCAQLRTDTEITWIIIIICALFETSSMLRFTKGCKQIISSDFVHIIHIICLVNLNIK